MYMCVVKVPTVQCPLVNKSLFKRVRCLVGDVWISQQQIKEFSSAPDYKKIKSPRVYVVVQFLFS